MQQQNNEPSPVVYVGNLSFQTSSAQLSAAFAKAGTIVSANLIADKFTRRSKGCGLVTFESETEAAAAIQMFNDTELDGRRLRCRSFGAGNTPAFVDESNQPTAAGQERSSEVYPNIIFVGNLDYNTSWQALKELFREAGPVRFADLIADRNGQPNGSGLITFEEEAGATRAIELFHNSDFGGRRMQCRKFGVGRRPPTVRPGFNRGPYGQQRPPQAMYQQGPPPQQY